MSKITDKQRYVEILNHLRKNPENIELDMKLKRMLIDRTLRKYTEERKPEYISVEATKLSNKEDIDLQITNHGSFVKTRKKGIDIMWEHCTPINILVDRVLDLESDINAILNDTISSIITKDEDNELNSNKFRYKRPGGFQKCYKSVGIEITEYKLK